MGAAAVMAAYPLLTATAAALAAVVLLFAGAMAADAYRARLDAERDLRQKLDALRDEVTKWL